MYFTNAVHIHNYQILRLIWKVSEKSNEKKIIIKITIKNIETLENKVNL